MEPFPDHSHGLPKPRPIRSDVSEPNSAPRVSSNPESTSSKRPHRHSPPHHHHRHHRHGSRHARSVVQSATQLYPPTSFGDLLKQVSRSRNTSPTRNQRARVEGLDAHREVEANARRLKPASAEDVAREQAKAESREEALLSLLHSLSDKSLKTSRRLDDTYYSILEKLSVLRQTIGSLQELSGLTKELHDTFLFDTNQLTNEIQGQIKNFGNFDAQDAQVKNLQERIQAGKEKADALMGRLAEARRRVKARAESDAEGEARTNRRFRTFWGMLGAIACVVFIIAIFQRFNPTSVSDERQQEFESGVRRALADAPIADETKEAIISPIPVRENEPRIQPPSAPSDRKEDGWTRVFDEL
ncbi:uncharacterized protein EI97DRAFT_457578 [Westerdykella ornata]|uniref:Uncharacterized protein n=1 Tax=Westerdykella ornata TaxID=318751 RepID=A0A6A6JNV5_WESOR|nr:uncharacterized protein EI97DRAFT_457578 [Westerdykella ornata]KAF2277578.1 hypothetical protein EI97DRAFT_457578 [Westerdykella ornata]